MLPAEARLLFEIESLIFILGGVGEEVTPPGLLIFFISDEKLIAVAPTPSTLLSTPPRLDEAALPTDDIELTGPAEVDTFRLPEPLSDLADKLFALKLKLLSTLSRSLKLSAFLAFKTLDDNDIFGC